MTRTIKFRGKRLDDPQQWEYGYYQQDETDAWMHTLDGRVLRIIPNTLGQFTGLHDKDGREIYEGDILSFRINGKIVKNQVGWIDSIAAFDFVKSKTPSFFNELCAKTSIIIGNIHEQQKED